MLLAAADDIGDREVGADRIELERVPAELVEALDAYLVGDADVERRHGRRPEDFLQLRAGNVRTAEVDRIDDVDAAVDEDVLAPGDHLVADAKLRGPAEDIEIFRNPCVE